MSRPHPRTQKIADEAEDSERAEVLTAIGPLRIRIEGQRYLRMPAMKGKMLAIRRRDRPGQLQEEETFNNNRQHLGSK